MRIPPVHHVIMENVLEIEDRSDHFVQVFNRNDAKALAALYTDAAELLAPGLPRMTGKKAIEAFWTRAFEEGRRTFDSTETVVINADTRLGYEYANWKLSVHAANGTVTKSTGKNLLIWEKVNGTWLICLDIWNTP